MRETTLTDHELAVMAAKENLLSLRDRAGYAEAIAPRPAASYRRAQAVTGALALVFGALAAASFLEIESLWLRLALTVLLGVLAGFSTLACIGMGPADLPERWGVAVVDKRVEGPRRIAAILREDGASHEVTVVDTIHAMLRPGDCGVAEITCTITGEPVIMVGFYRL